MGLRPGYRYHGRVTTRLPVVALVAVLAACGGGSTATSASETTVLQPPSESSSTSSPFSSASVPSSGEGGAPANYIEAVVTDAAERAGVPGDEVEVVEARSVEWPDGSLGCPEPGMMYTQVITPGYQIIVAVGDETFDYRLGRRGNFRLCENRGLDARDPDMTLPTVPTNPDE
jgi:hypothetical protein